MTVAQIVEAEHLVAHLLKTSESSELSRAINEALCGRSYVTPHIIQGMVNSLSFVFAAPDFDVQVISQRIGADHRTRLNGPGLARSEIT